MKQLEVCTWKEFEQIIKEILELHNYTSYWNVNLTIAGKRRQYDVVGLKNNHALIIDCKKWCNKRSKKSKLIESVNLHKERCKMFKQLFDKNIIPLIVTHKEDSIIEHDNVYIVPVYKFNDYLLKL